MRRTRAQDRAASQALLEKARAALNAGERGEARRLIRRAARLAPDWEAPWIFLATLSKPRAALAYLSRALEIRPDSPAARKHLRSTIQGLPPELRQRLVRSVHLPADLSLEPAPLEVLAVRRWFSARAVLPGILLVAALAVWLGSQPAFARQPQAAAVELDKATATPTPTPTSTPTPTPTATATATQTPLPPTPRPDVSWDYSLDPSEMANEGRWIDVDLGNQRVTAYEGEEVVRTFVVSTGTRAHPTVAGQFRIYVKYTATDMGGPGYYLPDVPYTMYFYRGYALHGTYWHSNFGTPMSHGCVNLATPDAEWLFGFASVGTLVNVHP